jgi:hypothetical protein
MMEGRCVLSGGNYGLFALQHGNLDRIKHWT